jgi:hypothetical protein
VKVTSLCVGLLLPLAFVAAPGCGPTFDTGGGGGGCTDCPCAPGYIKSGGVCLPTGSGISGLGSEWHPDPDGDGVSSGTDRCPHAYDPDQGDADSDGQGDVCDPDFAPPVEDGRVTDLYAEHVTPYGGWFSFTSPATTQYGWEGRLFWSTNRGEVEGGGGQGEIEFRMRAPYGQPSELPLTAIGMNPGQTYYVAVRAIDGQLDGATSNVVEIRTADDPVGTLGQTRPRIFSMTDLSARAASDSAFGAWEGKVGPEALSASPSDVEQMKYAIPAAVLWHATGQTSYRDKARTLFTDILSYYEGGTIEGNEYRWADAVCGITLDLLWDQLDQSTRNRAATAMLSSDELAETAETRLEDSDQLFADTRSMVIDGLVTCGATGIDTALATRGCDVLDAGLRRFYGIESVMMRRDRLLFAQSGGHMPDSTDYGQGTAKYWLQTLDALASVGVLASDHAGYVRNNFLATSFYSVTPRRNGLVPYGDVQEFSSNATIEANSVPISGLDADLAALQMGILDRAGLDAEASYAKHSMMNLYPDDDFADQYRMLLNDHDGIPVVDGRTALPLAYWDSGIGMFYDRTSWGQDASYLSFRAGWSGADHMHEDVGHFQLYRRGRWITHESIGYLGTAALADAHNVPLLEVDYEGERRPGQFTTRGSGPSKVTRLASKGRHAYAVADLTPAYRSHYYLDYPFNVVQRSLVWLKSQDGSGPDVVVIHDLVVNGPDGSGRSRGWTMHFDVAPSISGRTASVTLPGSPNQEVEVTAVLPSSTTLSTRTPEGPPDEYPAQIYTHRLVANPGSSSVELRSVVVLAAHDAGSSVDAPIAIESGDIVGVRIGDDIVLFPEGDAGDVTVSGDLPARVWWTGLVPEQGYDLNVSGGGGTVTLSLTSGSGLEADESGMLAVEISSGTATPIY